MEIDEEEEEGEISGAPGSFTVALPGDVPSPPARTFCRSHAYTVKVDIQAIPLLCVIAADFSSLFFSYRHVFPPAGISVHPTDIPAGAPGDRWERAVRDGAQSVRRALQRPLHHVWIPLRSSSAGLRSLPPLFQRYINFQSTGESAFSFFKPSS